MSRMPKSLLMMPLRRCQNQKGDQYRLPNVFDESRHSLPVYQYRESLLKAVQDHQVLVIVGEAGSGKTTQIPQYLHEAGYSKAGKVGCTQPWQTAAICAAERVSLEMGATLGLEVGYSTQSQDCTSPGTLLKYMTEQMLIQELLHEPDPFNYSVLMVEDAHENFLSTGILLSILKVIARSRPKLKLIISSATLDAKKFSDYFDCAPVFTIPGNNFPVEINYTRTPSPDHLDAAIVTVLMIHTSQPCGDGDILVFLTSYEEIETAERILMYRTRQIGNRVAELLICPLYEDIPTHFHAKVFEKTPNGTRKVVLATSIAETSIAIHGIRYVIDTGLVQRKAYNPRTGVESLVITDISKASAYQRARQSGRTSPGKCYRLYTADKYNELEDNTVPEVQRTHLANVVLILKSLGIHDLKNFDFIDPPRVEALVKAQELLLALGALDKHDALTLVGRKMVEFPLSPMLSKMIVASDKYRCSEEIITLAAMLSIGGSVFCSPIVDEKNDHFYLGDRGDHIALLKVYSLWKESNFSTQWCFENKIKIRSMERALDIRKQLEGVLKRAEIDLSSNGDLVAIKKAIISGYFPNLAKIHENESYLSVKHRESVYIHPSSGLAKVLPKWVVYHEIVSTTNEYMRQVSEVKPEWLLEIASHYYEHKDVEDRMLSRLTMH